MKSSKILAICFDMWGTLMKGGGVKLWQELYDLFHIEDVPIKEFIKLGEKSIMLKAIPLKTGLYVMAASLKSKVSKEEVERAFKLWWSYVETAKPYKETEFVLKRIAKLKIPSVIVSNTDISSFNFVIKKFGWNKYFNKFFLSAKIGVLKPHVKIFETVQDYLALPKVQILMVDDSLPHGVMPVRQFGWNALWVARGKKGKDKGRIEDLTGIFDFL